MCISGWYTMNLCSPQKSIWEKSQLLTPSGLWSLPQNSSGTLTQRSSASRRNNKRLSHSITNMKKLTRGEYQEHLRKFTPRSRFKQTKIHIIICFSTTFHFYVKGNMKYDYILVFKYINIFNKSVVFYRFTKICFKLKCEWCWFLKINC